MPRAENILRLYGTARNRTDKISGTTNSPMVDGGMDRCHTWAVAKKVGVFSLIDSSLPTSHFRSFSDILDEVLKGCVVHITYIRWDT